MPAITLPDGSVRQFDGAVTGTAIAESISKSLAKKAIGVRVDGELRDIFAPIENDASIELVTKDDADGLELIRHDAAHLLAQAVQELFPGTQVTIGPVIDDGFYYDFAREEPFSSDDLEKIEKLHEEATNEAFAKTSRLRWRQLVIRQFAGNLRKLADRLEPPQIPTSISSTTQHLTKQAR